MTPARQLAVPEGLDGERLDAALSRMFGLSRSKAAELIGDGMVLLGGRPAAKSDRVLAGDELEVTLPAPQAPEAPRPVEGLAVMYEDHDIIVVDKPRGVAAHPTPGWTGPTVTGGLLAAGQRGHMAVDARRGADRLDQTTRRSRSVASHLSLSRWRWRLARRGGGYPYRPRGLPIRWCSAILYLSGRCQG